MKLLRVRLKDFRGVAGGEIEPLPLGVTVIRGPNESGKTTFAEAVELVFDKLDSSTDRTVRAAQPVGRDVGSEVEVEVSAGGYRFRLFKRYNRNRETVLQVYEPAAEDHAGREAHERALEILGEHVDLDLWRALSVHQGQSLEQVAPGSSRSLLQALEGAGRRAAGEREETLFERARVERDRYFTPAREQPTGELKEARERALALRAEVTVLEDELEALDDDVDRAERLARRAAELAEALGAAEAQAAAARGRREQVDRLAEEVEARRAALREEEGKLRLVAELAAAEEDERALGERLAAAARDAADQAAALAPLAEQAAATAAAAERATTAAERARRDEELESKRRRLAALERAGERLAEADRRLAELAEALAAHRVTDAVLADLEARDRAAERAEAAWEAASAGLALEALSDLGLEIDGETLELAAGERLERRLREPLELLLPDALRLELSPGSDVEGAAERARETRRALAAACAEAAVESFAAARDAHRERRRLDTERSAAEAERRQALDGADPDELAAEATALAEEVAAALATHPADQAGAPADPGAAAAARRRAEEAAATARQEATAAAAARDRAAQAAEKAREVRRELEIERRHAGERLARSRQRIGAWLATLTEAGSEAAAAGGDAAAAVADPAAATPAAAAGDPAQLGLFRQDLAAPELGAALAAAERRAAAARSSFAEAGSRLSQADPETVRRGAEAAGAEVERLRRELRTAEGELAAVRGRLEARGERGLFDRAADARAALAAAERRARAVERRAAAAARLFAALRQARDRAREAYSEPLRAEIEELGRHLYGAGFAVELDDELRVARRTLDGVTLEVERLSAGAREQLALLARLSCARLAAPAGGVPLILDDALGHSDPGRLRAMAKVLELAGESCQVLVLTCFPERYAGVAGARMVDL